MRFQLLLFSIFLLLISCKKEKTEEPNLNYFLYENVERYTPNASYGVQNDGIELTISSFNYNYTTNEYSGSGNGIDFVKIKATYVDKLPVGNYQSFVNWGDTNSNFIGEVLLNVDTLFSGNYLELEIKSGNISISESPKGYLIKYEIILEDNHTIKGQYEGTVLKN